MTRPISFVGFVKEQIQQQVLIVASRGWESWVGRAARLRRAFRYNTVTGKAASVLGSAAAITATASVAFIGPFLTRGGNQ
jgi:hypothetical protein